MYEAIMKSLYKIITERSIKVINICLPKCYMNKM